MAKERDKFNYHFVIQVFKNLHFLHNERNFRLKTSALFYYKTIKNRER